MQLENPKPRVSISPSPSNSSSSSSTNIPVLVVPPSVTFLEFTHYSSKNDYLTYQKQKQSLTLYNPFQMELEFKIKATRPHLYRVHPSSGALPQRSSVSVVIGLNIDTKSSPSQRQHFEKDRFLIELLDSSKTVIGTQIIPVQSSATTENTRGTDKKTFQSKVDETSLDSSRQTSGTNSSAPSMSLSNSNVLSSSNNTTSNVLEKKKTSLNLERSFSSLFLRLFPLFVGATLVGLLSSGEISTFTNQSANLWICFCIGMLTMVIQLKFLEF